MDWPKPYRVRTLAAAADSDLREGDLADPEDRVAEAAEVVVVAVL